MDDLTFDDEDFFDELDDFELNENNLDLYDPYGDDLLVYEETEDDEHLFEPKLDYDYHKGKIETWQNLEIFKLLTIQWVLSQDLMERILMNLHIKYQVAQKYFVSRWICKSCEVSLICYIFY